MNGRRRRVWLMAAVLALAAAAVFVAVLFFAPRPTLQANPPGQKLLAASQGLDTVGIDAVFDPVRRTVTVTQILTLQNRTGTAQRLLVLRTYANAFHSEDVSPAATDELYDVCYPNGFSEGGLKFSSVRLGMEGGGEEDANYTYGDDAQTVLRISLPRDWMPEATLTLRMDYAVTVPQAAYRFGENEGVWALGNMFVIPAPYMDGAYQTDDYISIGDPFISECRNYTVRVTAPEAYIVAGSGAAVTESQTGGQRITRLDAPAARDFTMCLSCNYQLSETLQDGVLIKAYALTRAKADEMLRYGTQALHCYNERYGAYPYPCYTLCEVSFSFGGMEYPGLSMIASDKLKTGGETLEQIVAHETAHQWWYAVIGSDGYRQAWQDEALAEFSLLDYWESFYGADARAELQYSLVDTAMRVTVPQGVTPGSPVDYFGDLSEYRVVVYDRGAAALCALNTALQGKLDGFLSVYYDTYAFKLISREDFETLLKTYSGEDWSPLLSDYLDTYLNN